MIDVGPYYRQGAMPHGPRKLGRGPSTWHGAGCLALCVIMAARAIAGRAWTPEEASKKWLSGKAFSGSALIFADACRLVGMTGEIIAGVIDAGQLAAEIAHGFPIIVGVDYKDGSSSGFSPADHFLLVVGHIDGSRFSCVDTATGKEIEIDLDNPTYSGKPCVFSEMRKLRQAPESEEA